MIQSLSFKVLYVTLITTCFLVFASNQSRAQEWKQCVDVEKAGWSAAELEKSRQFATRIGSAAVMIVDQGDVVAAWGNIDHPYKTASIRKSVYDATIGATHLQHPFDLDATLSQMAIDDIESLSKQEQRATFEQLLTARSGVYHPAAYETKSNADRRPKRMSAEPGTQWYYNNWDFNVLCVAFEKLTDTTIENAFANRIAKPIGMEDFQSNHAFEYLEPSKSRHPAITFRLSARDLARVGKLYLEKGMWEGSRIVSADWVERSTEPLTTFEKGHYRGEGKGYGRLWWIWPAVKGSKSACDSHHRVLALGAGGQVMILFPELDVLIVHLADTDTGRGVSNRRIDALFDIIISSRKGKPREGMNVGPVRVEKLSGKAPQPLRTDLAEISKEKRQELEGRFMFNGESGLRIFQYEDRLFAQPLGLPVNNDAEVFLAPNGSLQSPDVNLVIEPVRAAGKVDSVKITFGGRTVPAKRVK